MSARKVLAIAAGEVGYSRWSDPKRGTKYARETQPVLWPNDKWLLANGISYCDIFVTWVFWKAGCLDILPGKQSYNVNYRASHGGHVSKSQAQPGDVIVLDWDMSTKRANHVGILEKVLTSGNLQCIEGNTSTGTRGSQSNGGRVARRVRRPSQVRYVIRPNWKAAPASAASKGTSKPVAKPAPSSPRRERLVEDGHFGWRSVAVLQDRLGVKVDGKGGRDTVNALYAYFGLKWRDGKLSRQRDFNYRFMQGINKANVEFTRSGYSPLVKNTQTYIGANADGVWGEATSRKLQQFLNRWGVAFTRADRDVALKRVKGVR